MLKVAIHGLGYLGHLNLSVLVGKGVYCYGYDSREEVKKKKNFLTISSFFDDLFDKPKTKDNFKLVNCPEELFEEDIFIHIISLGLESKDQPNFSIIESYLDNFKLIKKPVLIIFESTLYPGMIEKTILKKLKSMELQCDQDYYLGFAVRTDWIKNEWDLVNKPKKIVSGYTKNSLEKVIKFYSTTEQNFLVYEDYEDLEIVKHITNSLELIQQSFINQLSTAYSDYNINKIVTTLMKEKRIEVGLGSRGFATPISSRVLLDNTEVNELSILKESLLSDVSLISYIIEDLKKNEINSILLLGISSENDLKQLSFSPYLRLVALMEKNSIDALIYDPYFTLEELNNFTKGRGVENIYDLNVNGIIIGTPHNWINLIDENKFVKSYSKVNYFLDNGKLSCLQESITNYKSIGSKGWIK